MLVRICGRMPYSCSSAATRVWLIMCRWFADFVLWARCIWRRWLLPTVTDVTARVRSGMSFTRFSAVTVATFQQMHWPSIASVMSSRKWRNLRAKEWLLRQNCRKGCGWIPVSSSSFVPPTRSLPKRNSKHRSTLNPLTLWCCIPIIFQRLVHRMMERGEDWLSFRFTQKFKALRTSKTTHSTWSITLAVRCFPGWLKVQERSLRQTIRLTDRSVF